MFAKKLLAVAILATTCTTATHAAVIGFESGSLDPFFTYTGVNVLNGASFSVPASGYHQVANLTGSTYVAYNPSAVSPSNFFLNGSGTFTLNSLALAGAWGAQTLTIQGFNNGVELFSTLVPVTPSALTLTLNWAGIDQFRMITDPNGYTHMVAGGAGQHWALDNITVDEAIGNVPEPAMLGLLGLGFAGMALRRRKQKI